MGAINTNTPALMSCNAGVFILAVRPGVSREKFGDGKIESRILIAGKIVRGSMIRRPRGPLSHHRFVSMYVTLICSKIGVSIGI